MKRTECSLLPAVLALAAAVVLGAAPALAQSPEQVWGEAQGTLEDILARRADSGFAPIDSDTRAGRRLDGLLDQAVDLLAASDVTRLRQQIRERRAQIQDLNRRMADWQIAMIGAPPESGLADDMLGWLGPRTRDQYQSRIDAARTELARHEAEFDRLKQDFVDGLNRIGVQIDREQVDGLLGMATADDLVGMAAVFENMRGINQALLEATRATGESMEVARRYYGIHAVMMDIAVQMHERVLNRVDEDYLARLGRLVEETTRLHEQTRRQLAAERDDRLRAVLRNNAAAQELTLRAADQYRARLTAQRRQVAAAHDRLRHERDVAVNTFRTVDLSGSLLDLINASGRAFDALMQLQIPELRPFENLDMQREFERLTNQIGGSS